MSINGIYKKSTSGILRQKAPANAGALNKSATYCKFNFVNRTQCF